MRILPLVGEASISLARTSSLSSVLECNQSIGMSSEAAWNGFAESL
jgi:hypothetical protein